MGSGDGGAFGNFFGGGDKDDSDIADDGSEGADDTPEQATTRKELRAQINALRAQVDNFLNHATRFERDIGRYFGGISPMSWFRRVSGQREQLILQEANHLAERAEEIAEAIANIQSNKLYDAFLFKGGKFFNVGKVARGRMNRIIRRWNRGCKRFWKGYHKVIRKLKN